MHAILVSVVLLSTVHAPARLKRPTFPPVALFGPNINETLRFRPFDDHGRARKPALGELTHFLRCRQTGKQRRVDPRLMRALYTVGRHFAGHRVEVYSGYRPRAYCTRAHSRHLTASAVDFRVEGVANDELVKWLRATFHPSGVGYYPNGVHVHLDLDRARDTYWVDAGDDDANVAATTPLPDAPAADEEELLSPPLDDPAFPDGP
ncbi:MAG: YcbK family protein [Polyangia bacterium]